MAVGLIREDGEGHIELEIPIATEEFFRENWDRARKDMNISTFKENTFFTKEQMYIVFNDLELYRMWAKEHLFGTDLEYMIKRINELKEIIPEMFIDDETVLYIY